LLAAAADVMASYDDDYIQGDENHGHFVGGKGEHDYDDRFDPTGQPYQPEVPPSEEDVAAIQLTYERSFEQPGFVPPRPVDVLTFTEATPGFCCPLSANTYGIEFELFSIRDYESGAPLFEVQRDPDAMAGIDLTMLPPKVEEEARCIAYDFGTDFFKLQTIGSTLQFSVGPTPVENFRMVERFYFRNHLIRSYDFEFGFCIPNSNNSWEAIYDMPEMEPELIEDMIAFPWETQSDSFYFVGDELIMHNKAQYAYTPPPQ